MTDSHTPPRASEAALRNLEGPRVTLVTDAISGSWTGLYVDGLLMIQSDTALLGEWQPDLVLGFVGVDVRCVTTPCDALDGFPERLEDLLQ